jgi:DNA topoisomerase-1
MADSRGERMTVQMEARLPGETAQFQSNGRTITFPGYLRAYVEGSDDPSAELSERDTVLPVLAVGDKLDCRELKALEHRTQPPARFTEASLIKELEKEGIGRPSTYASIISTILHRQYVVKRGTALVPTFTAFAVVRLLEQFFAELVDTQFTARMEDTLDAISMGEQESEPYLHEFYFGGPKFPGVVQLIQAEIDPRQACTIPLGKDQQGRIINIRVGKYGPYLERNDERASIPVDQVPDELTVERAEELLERGSAPGVLGTHPESGQTVYLKAGRFGPYVQLGEQDESPRMKSLLPGQTPETLTLEQALQLLTLPRSLGTDPDVSQEIVVDLGRYGPYARRGEDTRSLASPDLLFTITLDEAKAVFAQPKSFRRGQSAPLRELGPHPQSQAPVKLMSGRFGPYVTDGTVNASLARGSDPAALTMEQAVALLAERVAKGPATKPAGRGPARKRAAASGKKPAATSAKVATLPAGDEAPAKARKPVVRKKKAVG